jgi:signal transduction histidine kinase
MRFIARTLARRREIAVATTGCAAGAALLWAGVTVHEWLGTAEEMAVARLAGAAADTVVAEWERTLRAPEPPVAPAGEVFEWTADELESPGERRAPSTPTDSGGVEASVAATLIAEAERQELVLQDPEAALELALEALRKDLDGPLHMQVLLRTLQLGVQAERMVVVRSSWEGLRAQASLAEPTTDSVPEWILGWLALPAGMKASEPIEALLSPERLGLMLVGSDWLTLGPPVAPEARFELAPLLVALLERLGLDPPPLGLRRTAALRRVTRLPSRELAEHRWQPLELAGRPFFARREGERLTGFFYAPSDLAGALEERAGLPPGFALDFAGDDESLGTALRARTELPYSAHAFTLRHADPGRIASAESSRMRLLRAAFLVLAVLFVQGGWRSARVIARERRLAELKSAFVAGISHDLRTPVASILLLAENLESGAAERSGRERYHVALRREATRLRRLIDDVLDFARLERGDAPRIEREPVELERFADELAADFRARVEGAGRSFISARGALPRSVPLDAHAVRRALENLLDNALKHGRGAVGLACTAAGGRLQLAVSDQGPGVPEGARERVFEPFERLAAANGHVGGTGLGLAIVRAIARAHGGEARVRPAEAGAGTVFELDLPLEAPGDEET